MHIGILNEVTLELEKSWKAPEINFPSMRLLTITMDVLKISSWVKKNKGLKKTGRL